MFNNPVPYYRVLVPVCDGFCQTRSINGPAFTSMMADKSNDSHAQILNFLLVSRIDIEGDGETFERFFLLLFIHFAVN